MRIRIGVLKDVIKESVMREDVTLRTSDGRSHRGDRGRIERALVQCGASKAERDAIVTGRGAGERIGARVAEAPESRHV